MLFADSTVKYGYLRLKSLFLQDKNYIEAFDLYSHLGPGSFSHKNW